MTRKTKQFWRIEMAAENLLKQNECFDAPYEGIDRMIESSGIDLIPLDIEKDKFCGMFGIDKNGYKFIAYSKNMIPERILFTKAHELGHFVLGHELTGEIIVDINKAVKTPQETEANVFAAALLMPKDKVIGILQAELADAYRIEFPSKKINITEDKINRLMYNIADSFKTSKKASRYRLKNFLNLT